MKHWSVRHTASELENLGRTVMEMNISPRQSKLPYDWPLTVFLE